MKSSNDTRRISKCTDDRPQGNMLHSQPFNLLDGKRPWQRTTKRKFQSTVHEPLPQARKPESSQGVRSQKQLACRRTSLSDPLQVFGDRDDGSDNQQSDVSGKVPSDSKERLLNECQGWHEMMASEKLSRERRPVFKHGLKDTTNLDIKMAHRQNSLPGRPSNREVLVLKEALRAEKEAFRSLRAELDEERNAAGSAANEAMAMIARLQEEKAAVLMEARQFKRMAEERENHNQEAISLLKEMLINKEEEALALENELVTCRQMFLAIEAGEPVESYRLMHLEGGAFDYRTVETVPNTAQVEGGLTSWISSYCDSKQQTMCGTDISQEAPDEDPSKSEFNGRTYGRSFKEFMPDNIRGNLERFFDKAEKPVEESHLDNHSSMVCDTTLDSTMDASIEKRSLSRVEGACQSSRSKAKFEESLRVEASVSSSAKGFMGGKEGSAVDRSLWQHIMTLEERIVTFEVEERYLAVEAKGTKATSYMPAAKLSVHQPDVQHWEAICQDGHCPQEVTLKREDSVERPTKLQCREGSHGTQQVLTSQKDPPHDLTGVSCMDYRCYSNGNTVKAPCSEISSDLQEGACDVYKGNCKCSTMPFYNSPVDESTRKVYIDYHEQPGLPPKLMTPDLETMHMESPTSPSMFADERNPSLSSSVVGLRQLTMRLQALEREKKAMHQAILSLKRENEELMLLQDIAQELHELKGVKNLKRTAETSEHPNKRARSEQPSLTSFLKGFLSYLPSSKRSQNSSLANPSSHQDQGFEMAQKDHVGLSYLLEKSPDITKSDTLLVRNLKVRVPPVTCGSLK